MDKVVRPLSNDTVYGNTELIRHEVMCGCAPMRMIIIEKLNLEEIEGLNDRLMNG